LNLQPTDYESAALTN